MPMQRLAKFMRFPPVRQEQAELFRPRPDRIGMPYMPKQAFLTIKKGMILMSLVSRTVSMLAGLALVSLAHAAEFKITTNSQEDGHMAAPQFANIMGCKGGNVSPQITWQGAPEGTKSYVVTLYDPDAPTGSGWWHWVVANIPANVTDLPADVGNELEKLPAGALSINNDMGRPGYMGICPPVGKTHRYTLTVHALKVEKLELPPNATPAFVGFMAYVNGLGKASIVLPGAR